MKKNRIILIFLVVIFGFIFYRNTLIQASILNACTLFLTKVFPSLFPMFLLCDFFVYFGLPELLAKWLGPFFYHVFHLSGYGAFAFCISLFSGTPANAYVIKSFVLQNKLGTEEASHVLSIAFFTNPLFLYTMLSLIFPGDMKTVLKLLLASYCTNLFLAIFFRPSKPILNHEKIIRDSRPFSLFLAESLQKNMNTMLLILGSITFFFIVNELVNPLKIPFITGIFEISQGLQSFIGLSSSVKELYLLWLISFGGLSIHLQIKSILSDSKVQFWPFFKMRLYEVLFSTIWFFL